MMFFVCSSRRITSITDVFRTASVGSDSAWIASGVYLPKKVNAGADSARVKGSWDGGDWGEGVEATHPVMRKWRRGVGMRLETRPIRSLFM